MPEQPKPKLQDPTQTRPTTEYDLVRIAAMQLAVDAIEDIDADAVIGGAPDDQEIERDVRADASTSYFLMLAGIAQNTKPRMVTDYENRNQETGGFAEKQETPEQYIGTIMQRTHNACVRIWGRNYDVHGKARLAARALMRGAIVGGRSAGVGASDGPAQAAAYTHPSSPGNPNPLRQYDPEDIEMTVNGEPVEPAPLPTTLRSKSDVTISNGDHSFNLSRLRRLLVEVTDVLNVEEQAETYVFARHVLDEIDTAFPIVREVEA